MVIILEISYDEFLKIGHDIIDLRDNIKYQRKHLPNSLNISLYTLIANPSNYLKESINYLLVCDYGLKSKKASEILNRMGYQAYSLKNGYK